MLWPLILLWALGACILVAAFAVSLGKGRFGVATIGLIVLGVLVMAASAIVGQGHDNRVHGVRVEVAK